MTSLPIPGSTPKRSRLTAPAREAQLLDVAENLFTECGYDGASIEDIARAAGVTRPTVYQHFGSKENIFLACVRRARAEFEEVIRRGGGSDVVDLGQRLRVGGSAYIDLIAADRRRWALLFTTSANIEGELADELTALRAQTISTIAEMTRPFAGDATEEAITAFAYIMSGIGEQLGRWWIDNPRLSRKAVLDYYAASLEGAAAGLLALPRARKRR